MYKSPIELTASEIVMQIENEVFTSIQKVGISVDKEELLRALQYDREQYEKGYKDGVSANKWIPCSERLPEEDGEYLCSRYFKYSERSIVEVLSFANDLYEQDQYDFCEYDGLKKSGFYEYDSENGYFEIEHVIAWMPLPEPYNGN